MGEIEEDITLTPEEDEDNSGAIVKKLREKLKGAEKKAEEYLLGWQKERADSANIRKRLEAEKQEFVKFSNEGLIVEILPALDSFDMAMGNREVWSKLPEQWTKGMEYVHSQLLSALENQGVKRIYPLHQDFDPNLHDALGTIETGKEADNNKVLEVIQPGYSYNGRMIRTAKVKVAEFKT